MLGKTPALILHKSCHSGSLVEVDSTCPRAVPVSLDADTLHEHGVIHDSPGTTTTGYEELHL